ncbi:LrgB family protein [Vibrio intestinalis]|uniref:LrgB family protein n=1 Tax=Vibrio intestinalis TaxID=2933291 RepID=UPI0021A2DDB6|nr:LrgB family protein [Vibrio intestinalis]
MWLITTILVFIFTRWLSQKIRNPLINPLLVSVTILISLLFYFDVSFEAYYEQSKSLSLLSQIAIVALAYPLYEQLPQIRSNWRIITLACGLGCVISMLSISLVGNVLNLDLTLIASLMGKSVTTPIAMEIASNLGGEPSIAAILVLIAGLVGAILAYPIYNMLNITHPIARGLTMGTVSHALGTATCAEKNGEDAAFSSLALVVCGVITSILAPSFFALAMYLI